MGIECELISLHWLDSHLLYAIFVQWSILPTFYHIHSPPPPKDMPSTPKHILSATAYLSQPHSSEFGVRVTQRKVTFILHWSFFV